MSDVVRSVVFAYLCLLLAGCPSQNRFGPPGAGAGGEGGGLGGGLDAGSGGSSGTGYGTAGIPAWVAGRGGAGSFAAAGSGGYGGYGGRSGYGGYGGGGSGGFGGARAGSGGTGGSGAAKCSTPTQVASNAVARNTDGKGQITQQNVCVPQLGVISSITLKYMLSSYFGEPTHQAVFAYYASFDIANAFWIAQVMTTAGQPVMVNGKLVYATWEEGAWPDPGGEFGFDSTGSPMWWETFSYYSGGQKIDGYVDETNAKAIYKAGFTLDRLRIVSVDTYPVLY